MGRALFQFCIVLLAAAGAMAAAPDERLADPALEERANRLGHELRCLVCDNETIEESQAPLAADLRRIVRERIIAGDTDKEIRDRLAQRYGEYVLFRPRFNGRNLVLWLGPFALLAGALALLLLLKRNARAVPPAEGEAALSAEEEAALKALLPSGERRD